MGSKREEYIDSKMFTRYLQNWNDGNSVTSVRNSSGTQLHCVHFRVIYWARLRNSYEECIGGGCGGDSELRFRASSAISGTLQFSLRLPASGWTRLRQRGQPLRHHKLRRRWRMLRREHLRYGI